VHRELTLLITADTIAPSAGSRAICPVQRSVAYVYAIAVPI
jgi:hypothetical protein